MIEEEKIKRHLRYLKECESNALKQMNQCIRNNDLNTAWAAQASIFRQVREEFEQTFNLEDEASQPR